MFAGIRYNPENFGYEAFVNISDHDDENISVIFVRDSSDSVVGTGENLLIDDVQTHDFGDGNGEVPAHPHLNGGGWVAETAIVDDTAYVGRNAQVYGKATVTGKANICGHSVVCDKSYVGGSASIHDYAKIFGNARVYEKASVHNHAKVYDEAMIRGEAIVLNRAEVYGTSRIMGSSQVNSDVVDAYLNDGVRSHVGGKVG